MWFTRSHWTGSSREELLKAEAGLLEGLRGCIARDVAIGGGEFIRTIDIPGNNLVSGGASASLATFPFWVRRTPENSALSEVSPSSVSPLESFSSADSSSVSSCSGTYSSAVEAPPPVAVPLVLWPGYGMGIGAFALTFPFFQRMFPDRVLHAVDWLGYGGSTRPAWTARGVDATEDFFVSAMESWRERNGIQKMILLGHSMGGYLSVAYAERFPDRVEHLILASPCGVSARPAESEIDARLMQQPWHVRGLLRTAGFLWEQGWTPQSVLRMVGHRLGGRKAMLQYVQKRFKNNGQWTEQVTPEKLGEYQYQVWAAPGSGEYVLAELLHPGAYAKSPLAARIAALRVPKVSMFYGDDDWMDVEAARKLVVEKVLKEEKSLASRSRNTSSSIQNSSPRLEQASGRPITPFRSAAFSTAGFPAEPAGGRGAIPTCNRASTTGKDITGITTQHVRQVQPNDEKSATAVSEDEATNAISRAAAIDGAGSVNYRVGSAHVPCVPKGGHQMYLENPEAFVETVAWCLENPNLLLLSHAGVAHSDTYIEGCSQSDQ